MSDIKIEGMADVKRALTDHLKRKKAEIQDALTYAVNDTFYTSNAACPYDSTKSPGEPHLRDSAKQKIGNLKGSVSYGGDGVTWQWYVEMGHHTRSGSYVSPNPYLFPAFEDASTHFKAECERIAGSA